MGLLESTKFSITLASVTVNLAGGSITDGTYTIIQSSTDGSGSGFICSAVFSVMQQLQLLF